MENGTTTGTKFLQAVFPHVACYVPYAKEILKSQNVYLCSHRKPRRWPWRRRRSRFRVSTPPRLWGSGSSGTPRHLCNTSSSTSRTGHLRSGVTTFSGGRCFNGPYPGRFNRLGFRHCCQDAPPVPCCVAFIQQSVRVVSHNKLDSQLLGVVAEGGKRNTNKRSGSVDGNRASIISQPNLPRHAFT